MSEKQTPEYSLFKTGRPRKYSNTFMHALRDFMEFDEQPDEDDQDDLFVPRAINTPREEPTSDNNVDLPYDANQYSPTNPGGDRKYSKEFLKAVCRSMKFDESHVDDGSNIRAQLQYDDDQQYRPANKAGHKRYSCRFLKAVGSSLTYDGDKDDLSSLLNERPVYPWELDGRNKAKRQPQDRSSVDFTSTTTANDSSTTKTGNTSKSSFDESAELLRMVEL